MLLTLGAAGATLLVMLAVVGIPAIDACSGDARGLVACLRGIVDAKFDLGLSHDDTPPLKPPEQPMPATVAAPIPTAQVADAPVTTPGPSRSLVPPVAEKSPTPEVAGPPQVAVEPPVAVAPQALPAAVETVDEDQADAAPAPETIALATLIEPDAPAFVPAAPAIVVNGVPPDLQAAATLPTQAVSDFVLPATPELPTTPPPDLVARAEVPVSEAADAPELPAPEPDPALAAAATTESAPAFVLPATPDLPTTPPPELTVAAAGPLAPAEPAPDFPDTPALPTTPPPDLAIAAVEPVVPETSAPAAVPVLVPTIDAVEIDGDGNFIAGNGPAGATMRLYVDGIVAGVSPVEGGRWLVEGTDLLTEPKQTLKVEALDPLTGKVIGEATVKFERPAAPAAETPAVVPAPTTGPGEPGAAIDQPVAPLEEPEAEETPALTDAPVAAEAPAEPSAKPMTPASPEPTVATEMPAVVDAPMPAADTLAPIPEIAAVSPATESPSVTILKPATMRDDATLATGAPSDAAVVTLGASPKSPAVMAHFILPASEASAEIAVLRAVPFGDPGAGRFVSGKAIIRRGDTLWDIAHRYYGRGIHYRTIFRANRELITRPGKIYPGQVFDLPLVYDD